MFTAHRREYDERMKRCKEKEAELAAKQEAGPHPSTLLPPLFSSN